MTDTTHKQGRIKKRWLTLAGVLAAAALTAAEGGLLGPRAQLVARQLGGLLPAVAPEAPRPSDS